LVEKQKDASKGLSSWFTGIANQVGMAWWVEVTTTSPRCTYYFGPFLSETEAQTAKPGYLEDIEREGAQGMQVVVKRCKPSTLTVCEDSPPERIGSFSGQMR
jgi:Domain of unknown function (DUF1816)